MISKHVIMTDPAFNFAFDLDESTVSVDSVRAVTDSLRSSMSGRTTSSIRQNIESTMKERASLLSLKKMQPNKENERNETNEADDADDANDSNEEKHESTPNQVLVHLDSSSVSNTKELLRLLEESRRTIETLQKEKEEERAAVMRLYEEDKKRREKEEEDEKEQKKLDALYALFQNKFVSLLSRNLHTGSEDQIKKCEYLNTIVDQLKLTGEITLFIREPSIRIVYSEPIERISHGLNGIMITNRNVYFLYYKREGLVISPMYTFTETLNSKYVSLLYNMTQLGTNGKRHISMIPTMKYGTYNNSQYNDEELKASDLVYIKNFESIIRYIPGGYINGHWKQLNGFYGMYLNEQTLELSDIPPPLV